MYCFVNVIDFWLLCYIMFLYRKGVYVVYVNFLVRGLFFDIV